MSLRREFVMLASEEGANRRELCRRYAICPTTGYKWLARARAGEPDFADRSRRPLRQPNRTPASVEAQVLALRDRHPAWGGRKLQRRLRDLGHAQVPSASTITEILRRHGRLDPAQADKHAAWQRFVHAAPNQLWQMDFKGHFALPRGRCHPLSVIDDHSRFALTIAACGDEQDETVRTQLVRVFRRYGLPERMLADNGPPWGSGSAEPAYTALEVWLLRLGISLIHGRPYHPQTQGKDERFHRTLKAEAIGTRQLRDLIQCQHVFDAWRTIYNFERPHQALKFDVPARHYTHSPQPFPESLPAIDYGPSALVRKVDTAGRFCFRGHIIRLGKAFAGQPVALRPTQRDGIFDVVFCHQPVAEVDLHAPQ